MPIAWYCGGNTRQQYTWGTRLVSQHKHTMQQVLHAFTMCLVAEQGDNTIEPTTANFTFKHTLEQQDVTYEIDLCPSQLRGVSISASYAAQSYFFRHVGIMPYECLVHARP